jgi:hypothetical protein
MYNTGALVYVEVSHCVSSLEAPFSCILDVLEYLCKRKANSIKKYPVVDIHIGEDTDDYSLIDLTVKKEM